MGQREKPIQVVIFLFLFIFLLTFVSAETYEQGSDIDIKVPVRVNGAITSGITCNISVTYPNNSILVDFKSMTDSNSYFNYTLNSSYTQLKGTYEYCITCTDGTYNATECYSLLINLGGITPTDQTTHTETRTILVFFGLAVICLVSVFFIQSFPIRLTFFLLMVWFLLMGINFTYIGIADTVLNPSVENFFSFFLTISFYANYFIFLTIIILWLVTLIVNTIQMKKRRKANKYGFEGLQ